MYPTAIKNKKYVNNICDKRRSTNFIVLGVKGFVHKGNDLLIEVFKKHVEWRLYLCGREIEQECKKIGCVRSENVVDCGFVEIESQKFLELVSECTFILLPSCSEGMSTALLTGMRHGLIPVTTKGTGMDELYEYCQYFEGYHIDQIEKKLIELTKMGKEEIKNMSDNIYEYANQIFSISSYAKNLREIFEDIM